MAVATNPFTEKTEEQQAITEMVRQFVDNEVLPIAEEHDHEDKFPEAVVEHMKELGLFGVTIPEEYGGMGLDLTTYAMIVEELSRGWISVSGIVNTHFIGSYLLMKFGTDEQKEPPLPRRQQPGTSARLPACGACLSRMLGNGHVLVLRGAGHSNVPGLPVLTGHLRRRSLRARFRVDCRPDVRLAMVLPRTSRVRRAGWTLAAQRSHHARASVKS